LQYARERLEPLGVRVSADVFGLSATRDVGVAQVPRRISRYLDAIYPMVYPSHYGSGEFNLPDPNAQPARTVALSLQDFALALRGQKTRLVPWLQDFSLGREYTLDDVRGQIMAARDAQSEGFLLWNPSGVYTAGALAGK
ncbi:MAG: putative glycoside hydrolase, partial [Gaiellaceae bacterium]